MTPLKKGTILSIAAGAMLVVALAGALLSTGTARGQTQSDQQTIPQGQMPMMGPGMNQDQGRWMWPRRGWMGQGGSQWMGPGMGPWMGRGASMVRHMYYMHNGVPSDYRGKVSPLAATPDVVSEGARLYAKNCASCHGAQGFGDGQAGRDLNPPPANLAHMIRMPMLNDEYLLWTMSEGGAPVGSEMQAFKDTLTEDEMWKIVAAMRAGFPAPTESGNSPAPNPQAGDTPPGGLLSVADVRAQLEQWVLWYGNPNLKVGSVTEKEDNMIVGEIVTQDDSLVQRIEVDRRTGWMRPVR